LMRLQILGSSFFMCRSGMEMRIPSQRDATSFTKFAPS